MVRILCINASHTSHQWFAFFASMPRIILCNDSHFFRKGLHRLALWRRSLCPPPLGESLDPLGDARAHLCVLALPLALGGFSMSLVFMGATLLMPFFLSPSLARLPTAFIGSRLGGRGGRLWRLTSDLSRLTSQLGRLTSDLSRLTSRLWRLTSDLSALALDV